MKIYINFYFKNIEKEGDLVTGKFESLDNDVRCDFIYNISTKEYEILNHNKSKEEILPLPFYWLDMKLEENGTLKQIEGRVCY